MGNPRVQQGVAAEDQLLGDRDEDAGESIADKAPTLDMLSAARERAKQPKFKFTFNDKVRRKADDPKEVVLSELTAGQEEMVANLLAGKREDKTGIRLATELVKMSLYKVDGKVVNHADAEGDFYWGRWSAKVRKLLLIGFSKIHNTTDEEDDSFLDGMTPA